MTHQSTALRIHCRENLQAEGGALCFDGGGICFWIGIACVVAGVFIILALVLPAGFWLFALGGALIAAGVWLLRC